MAAAGIIRLGLENEITHVLDPRHFVPSGCQGIIGMEIRSGDDRIKEIVEQINHQPTFPVAVAERQFLKTVQGGCKTPIGCYVECKDTHYTVTGLVADPNGRVVIHRTRMGTAREIRVLATEIAGEILEAGGKEILEAIHNGNRE